MFEVDLDNINTSSVPPLDKNERQYYYMAKVRDIIREKSRERGKPFTFFIQTFGCQMNAHDSEKLRGMLREMDYEEAEEEKNADFVIYNTCCVRENAENKVYGNLGYLKHSKRENPHMKIALCGCMMQQDTVLQTIRQKYKHVDIVFGTFNLYKLAELMYTNFETEAPVFDIWKEHGDIVEDLPTIRHFKYKASVNIMFGCNNFCSYCIVPYVRGRERSRCSADIINEIKALAADGVKEVTLLGQNVNSYGRGLEEEITFAKLLRMVNEVEGIERIRFMTSHPKDLSDELIYAMRDCEKVCKHIHLPVQAGNDEILRVMNRKYTKQHYLGLVEKIRKEIPDIAITTDIMVGFPGETKECVEDTIDVIKKARFNGAFTFIYSKRTGTPAAVMENQIPEDQVKKNFNRVLEALNPIIYELNCKKVGKVYKVMADDVSTSDESYITGRLEDNSLVHFKGDRSMIGDIFDVKITDCKTFYLIGEKV
ncbi:MAG: tRNA (N6-isopentenyl adenosine(37)-C2)-methylthiotransferase MiaB [Clostridia bacterium]|nr:tRNA (N6-isopentenyl adenosine(37)-C2)-methylthiotransferase MiaB [Clostridia bacterium]